MPLPQLRVGEFRRNREQGGGAFPRSQLRRSDQAGRLGTKNSHNGLHYVAGGHGVKCVSATRRRAEVGADAIERLAEDKGSPLTG